MDSDRNRWRNRASRTFLRAGTAFVMAFLLGAGHAIAQAGSSPAVPTLTDAEVKARYQNCPNGYYSGPRPGKARYTKDNFIWTVTPEFARKFCMPPEFVSTELKGAEAVAFRIVEDADEETCGWGGRGEVCARMKELRFEIYFDAAVVLPKENDLKLSVRARRPSALLITRSKAAIEKDQEAWRRNPTTDPKIRIWPAFGISQFGLDGFKDGKVIWPIAGLREYIWNENIFEGINYLALQGSTGFLANPRMENFGVTRFAIVVRRLGDTKKSHGRAISEFAHVIELPESFTDQVRAADKARGMKVEELGMRSFGIAR